MIDYFYNPSTGETHTLERWEELFFKYYPEGDFDFDYWCSKNLRKIIKADIKNMSEHLYNLSTGETHTLERWEELYFKYYPGGDFEYWVSKHLTK